MTSLDFRFMRLRFPSNGEWKPLPDWAKFFLKFGSRLADMGGSDTRLRVGISVPSLSFAPCFLGTGLVISKLDTPPTKDDIRRYFLELCSYPKGTPVTVIHTDQRIKKGYLEGVQEIEGEKRLCIRIESDKGKSGRNLTMKIQQHRALSVNLLEMDGPLKLPNQQKGRSIKENSLLEAFLGDPGMRINNRLTHLDCLFVGRIKQIKFESTQFHIAVKEGNNDIVGNLNDFLRIREYLSPREPYRSAIVSALRKPKVIEKTEWILFVGAKGYVEWRHLWPDENHIVIMDRTRQTFSNGLEAYNSDVENADALTPIPHIRIPEGIEVAIAKQG